MASRQPQQPQGQSVLQKMKMGAMMGGTVGLTIGFIFGSYSIIKNGAGPRGPLASLSQTMLGSAASFAFFLSIGSVIRTDAEMPPHIAALHASLLASHPVMRSRAEGASLIRSRWLTEKNLSRPVSA